MKVLVINCGSSSLKFQLIDSITEACEASGLCERIGLDGSLTYKPTGKDKMKLDLPMPTHTEAIQYVIQYLIDATVGVVKSLDEIGAVGHRIVHGGEKFTTSALLTDEVLAAIEECNDLAPLHNPANLIGVEACVTLMPNTPMVGVFDTAFHQSMPAEAYTYGLPYEYYEKYKVRRYGFHGTSHSYVGKRLADLIGRPDDYAKLIVCHLGNGSSISAIKNGQSVDTSMGLTPLEGLVMGTRSGDIDPAIIDFIAAKEEMTVSQVTDVLNKKSGVFGVSGISSDFRDIKHEAQKGNKRAQLSRDVFCYRVAKYIGSYVAAMNGVDAIAFTAGVGENDYYVRAKVCEYLGYLGIYIDAEANLVRGEEREITYPDCPTRVFVVPTNEELAIARETVEVLAKN